MSPVTAAILSTSAGERPSSDTDFPTASIVIIITSATRARSAGRVPRQRLAHERQHLANAGLAMLPRFRRIAIERRGVAQRQPQGRLLALRPEEGAHQRPQALSGGRLRSARMSRSSAPVWRHSSACRRNRMASLFGKYW